MAAEQRTELPGSKTEPGYGRNAALPLSTSRSAQSLQVSGISHHSTTGTRPQSDRPLPPRRTGLDPERDKPPLRGGPKREHPASLDPRWETGHHRPTRTSRRRSHDRPVSIPETQPALPIPAVDGLRQSHLAASNAPGRQFAPWSDHKGTIPHGPDLQERSG